MIDWLNALPDWALLAAVDPQAIAQTIAIIEARKGG
jgi:hypothetical protein